MTPRMNLSIKRKRLCKKENSTVQESKRLNSKCQMLFKARWIQQLSRSTIIWYLKSLVRRNEHQFVNKALLKCRNRKLLKYSCLNHLVELKTLSCFSFPLVSYILAIHALDIFSDFVNLSTLLICFNFDKSDWLNHFLIMMHSRTIPK